MTVINKKPRFMNVRGRGGRPVTCEDCFYRNGIRCQRYPPNNNQAQLSQYPVVLIRHEFNGDVTACSPCGEFRDNR